MNIILSNKKTSCRFRGTIGTMYAHINRLRITTVDLQLDCSRRGQTLSEFMWWVLILRVPLCGLYDGLSSHFKILYK